MPGHKPVDRLTFPRPGAGYFTITAPAVLVGPGATVQLLTNYTLPDFQEGVIRTVEIVGYHIPQMTSTMSVLLTIDGQEMPYGLYTRQGLVQSSIGPFTAELKNAFFELKGRSRISLTVSQVAVPFIMANVITSARLSGHFYR